MTIAPIRPRAIGSRRQTDRKLAELATNVNALQGAQGGVFVYRQAGIVGGNVYTDWATLMAAKVLVKGQKLLEISSIMEFVGGALSYSAGTVTYTAPAGSAAIPATVVVGQQVVITGAANSGNNGNTFAVATRVSSTSITFANASGVTEAAFAGRLSIMGGFTCIIPAAGMPTGGWDMTETEMCGYSSPVSSSSFGSTFVQFGGAASGGDVQFYNWLETGGHLTVTNLNVTLAANVIPAADGAVVEWGCGSTGDFPTLNNNGTAAMWDSSASPTTKGLTLRLDGVITGTSPAVVFGASVGKFGLNLKGTAKFHANMLTGSSSSATANITKFSAGARFARQQGWTGSINEAAPPYTVSLRLPQALLQVAPIPATAAIATSLGMNTTLNFNTTAGNISQTLPLIRAAAPATGSDPTSVAGAIDSTGMQVTVKNQTGANAVLVSPSGTTPDTIEGGASAVVVPSGCAVTFQSDGVSNWTVISTTNFETVPATLSGAGTLNITHRTTLLTTTGAGQAIVLPNGTRNGQRHTVVHTVDGGSAVITPTTAGNFANVTLTNVWESAEFEWSGAAWNVVQANPVAIVA